MKGRGPTIPAALLAVLLAALVSAPLLAGGPTRAGAEVVPDEHGAVAEVAVPYGAHWLWVGDRLLRHAVLFDGDSGDVQGMVDVGWTLSGRTPHVARSRGELYVVEIAHSRGHRGEREDFVTVYDAATLAPVGEISFSEHAAHIGHGVGVDALLDGDRFLLVFHQNPATSVSVLDVVERRFVAEIPTAGCALVYPVSERRFGTLCGDGTAMAVDLTADGRLEGVTKSAPFFDATATPVSEKGARDGTTWHFASFDGRLFSVDFSVTPPTVAEPWDLVDEGERRAGWLVGGAQHLAVHAGSRRLYSLMHVGGPGSHKDAGSEIWVFDLDRKTRTDRFETPSLLPAFLRPYIGVETGTFTHRLLGWLLPNLGAHSIVVTEDDEPLLFLRHNEVGAIGIVDASSGEHLRDLEESGVGGGRIAVP